MALGTYFDAVLGAARVGAPWAWETIFRDLSGPVMGFARTHSAGEPEDILQETFLSAARDIHRFEGDEGDFRSWIFTIAHRRIVDSFRKAGREVARADGDDAARRAEGQWLGNVEQEAMTHMSMMEVTAIVRALSAAQRDVLLLRVVADLSVSDTARILHKSEGAIKTLQSRALKALREIVGGA